jgi:uncharacterized protein (DUF305 family)
MIGEDELLSHVYQTAEMGEIGIRAVRKHATDQNLQSALDRQLAEYEKLRRSAQDMLGSLGRTPTEVGTMARWSSQMMTAMKTSADHSATKIAELMIQGSTMGVTKSLRTIRDCDHPTQETRALADKLLKTEQANIEEMKQFL